MAWSATGGINSDGILTPADTAIALVIAAGDGWATVLDTLMILQGWLDDIHNYRKTINTLKKVRKKAEIR